MWHDTCHFFYGAFSIDCLGGVARSKKWTKNLHVIVTSSEIPGPEIEKPILLFMKCPLPNSVF